MQRLEVMLVLPTLLGGGAERIMVTLSRFLDRQKFRVTFVVVDMRNAAYADLVPGDVEFIDLRSTNVRNALFRIASLIWRRRPDVVLSTLSHMNLALGMVRWALPRKTRFIARETIVVSELLRTMFLAGVWAMAYRWFYGQLDAIVCQSRDVRDDLVANFRIAPEKLSLVHNPVDIDFINRQANEPVETGIAKPTGDNRATIEIVAAGRLTYQKGFDILIDALALAANPRFRLTILGEGPQREFLEKQVIKQQVETQVRFVGFQKNPFPYLAQADAFVLSSRFEGLPNVVLEALACGTPVIATPAPGGVREILDGLQGCILADRIDSESLAQAFSRIVPGARLSSEVVRQYEVPRILEQYEQLLNACVSSA